jgi:hypothetical protein
MAVAQGYGKTVTSGSVFAYDVADTRNSYRGEPTVNLIGNFVNTYNEDYWVRATNYYQLEATAYIVQDENAPGGAYTYVTGNTSDTNAQLFWSAGNTICNEFGQQVSVSAWLRGSGEVRLIAYDDTTGYKSGPAITLTDQWTYHKFSTTFGSGGTQANHWVGVRGITTGEYVHVAQMQWERKSHATQYVRGTRSVTQGLLPLVGNSTIDLSNVSFDSNAQMLFDETDDRVNMGDTSFTDFGTGNFSVECVIYIDPSITVSTGHFKGIIVKKGAAAANSGFAIYYNTGQGKFLWSTADGSSAVERFTTNTWSNLVGSYAHIIMVRDSGATNNGHFYINGVYESITSGGALMNVNNDFNLSVGASSTLFSNYFFNGKIPVAKIYNRALSAGEIRQNYLHYKTRFNLS